MGVSAEAAASAWSPFFCPQGKSEIHGVVLVKEDIYSYVSTGDSQGKRWCVSPRELRVSLQSRFPRIDPERLIRESQVRSANWNKGDVEIARYNKKTHGVDWFLRAPYSGETVLWHPEYGEVISLACGNALKRVGNIPEREVYTPVVAPEPRPLQVAQNSYNGECGRDRFVGFNPRNGNIMCEPVSQPVTYRQQPAQVQYIKQGVSYPPAQNNQNNNDVTAAIIRAGGEIIGRYLGRSRTDIDYSYPSLVAGRDYVVGNGDGYMGNFGNSPVTSTATATTSYPYSSSAPTVFPFTPAPSSGSWAFTPAPTYGTGGVTSGFVNPVTPYGSAGTGVSFSPAGGSCIPGATCW